MGLASKADVSVTKLSQVELRKMELARAMATHPKLLISDEASIVHGEIVVAADSVDELKGNDIVKRLYLGGVA
jgi:branched-chain amino acid transport system ATP-binding protein